MNKEQILEYWNNDKVKSMYDKHLLSLEIMKIKKLIRQGSSILDAGCGEGEGTVEYAKVKDVKVIAADFSDIRLKKATDRLIHSTNVILRKTDFLIEFEYTERFDFIITQRFLINLVNWNNQKNVLRRLKKLLVKGGSFILLEGSKDGAAELNKVRQGIGMEPIRIPQHNSFLDDDVLEEFMLRIGFSLEKKDGLGSYYLLTRAIRPFFDHDMLNWYSKFNGLTAKMYKDDTLTIGCDYSRTRIWHFKMINDIRNEKESNILDRS